MTIRERGDHRTRRVFRRVVPQPAPVPTYRRWTSEIESVALWHGWTCLGWERERHTTRHPTLGHPPLRTTSGGSGAGLAVLQQNQIV